MNDLIDLLARNTVFKMLADEQRAGLASEAVRRQFRRGEIISLYGDVWPFLLLVGAGRVQAVKESSEGRQLMLLSLEPGEIFWGLAFFNDDAAMPVTLVAAEDSRLYLWPREGVLPALLANSPALWALTQLMVRRMQQASQIVEGLAFQPVAARLAGLILRQFGGGHERSVARSLTLDEMAARVGSTREMVCRILYRFADENLIEVTRTEFTLTDEEGLARLSEQV